MNLHSYGRNHVRIKWTLSVLVRLANGWVYGLRPKTLKMVMYNKSTGEGWRGHPPVKIMERLIKQKYVSNHSGEYRINKAGIGYLQKYQQAATHHGIDTSTITTSTRQIKAHTQLGRPPRQRGPIWDRGYNAASTGEACPYDGMTEQSRGYAKIWRAGNDAARRQLVSTEIGS